MLNDLKLAYRQLRNAPAFTGIAIATLALAIGANTAIFSIADAVLFRPLPYDDPARVHVLSMVDSKSGAVSWAVPYLYVQAIVGHHAVGKVGLRSPTMMTIHAGGPEAEWLETLAVSPDYFQVLGVRAVRGRVFEPADAHEPERVALLTYETWQQRFGADERVIGQTVKLGPINRSVIGVLPRGFVFPATSLQFLYSQTGRPAFVTVEAAPADATQKHNALVMSGSTTNPVVRLDPGVTRAQAQAEIDALVAPMRSASGDGIYERVTLTDPREILFPTGRPIMGWLVAAAALVLLIGCVNLANMLLIRARRREHETGMHLALGATRLRIVRPILFETLAIGTAASLIAVVVTWLTFDLLLHQVPPVAYGSAPVQVDVRTAVFALALGVVAGLVFAVVPAWASTRLDVRSLVVRNRADERRRGFLRYPLIAMQVAIAIVLVFGAVITGRAFVSVLRVPLGFTANNVAALNIRPNVDKGETLRAFYLRAIETLARRGDVVSASAGGSVPPDGWRAAEAVDIMANQQPAGIVPVLPGYFETLGIPLIRGRLLSWEDLRDGSGTAVIAESTARALYPASEAIGNVFRSRSGRQFTVVGIVADVQRSFGRTLDPPAYVIPPDDTTRALTIVARVRSRQATTLAEIRREVGALSPATPVSAVWWSDSISALTAYRNPRFQTLVLGSFAALALGLTALGIFGVVAFLVASRTREIGVRLALGAPPGSVVRLMVRQQLTAVLTGTVIGIIATQWLRRIAEAQLFEINARDPAILVAAAATVLVAALVAAYLPARHASRVDPVLVLRAE